MVSVIAMALLFTQDKTIVLPTQTVKDVDGHEVALPAKDAKATVMLFIAVDCPISNRYAPEMGRLYTKFNPLGVSFVRVYVDDSVELADIRQHGRDFKMPSAALLDGKHELVKKLRMTVTPEVAVIGPDGTVQYRGRINDLYADHGRVREGGEFRQDLRVALEEIVAGKPVSKPFTTAIGCGIPEG